MYNPKCSPFVEFKNAAFLGQYHRTNWSQLLEEVILHQEGIVITGDGINTDDKTAFNSKVLADGTTVGDTYKQMHEMYEAANFNKAAMKWINYYPGAHFDKAITERLAAYLRVNIHRAWISRIDPGYFAPLHWDIDDNEIEYLKKGDILRYSGFISKPAMGHAFVLADEMLYNQKQGTLVKWNNHREWHIGINGAMTPKCMIHIVGYRS